MTDTILTVATGSRPTELDRALDRFSALDGRLHDLRAAWTGTRPMAYLSPKSREALGDRLGRLGVNYPRLTVESLAERMTLSGMSAGSSSSLWLEFVNANGRSEEHTSELQSRFHLVCRHLLEKIN